MALKHAEKRRNLWYAVLDVPADVRHLIGKKRFVQSTGAKNIHEAAPRVALLVAGWKSQIAKSRGMLPDEKAGFWGRLRADMLAAKERGDDATEGVIFDIADTEAQKVKNPEEAARLYRLATDQAGTLLAPLVEEWKASLRMVQKTIDQQHRDVRRMADHFMNVESLTAPGIKSWTDKLKESGTTSASFERIGVGCRSFWRFLQDSGVKSTIDPDPFSGPFKLAQRTAKSTSLGRTDFEPSDLARLYVAALARRDQPLADLIALGAYTGARIEEICSLTKTTAEDGVLRMGTKTEASRRETPVHPAIAPMVARLIESSGDGYLIPSKADNQYSNRSGPLSQRFGHLKRSLGFGRGHVFHSCRHTLTTLLQHADVAPALIADVLGHEKGKGFTLTTYGSGSSLAQKLAALAKIQFPAPLDAPR